MAALEIPLTSFSATFTSGCLPTIFSFLNLARHLWVIVVHACSTSESDTAACCFGLRRSLLVRQRPQVTSRTETVLWMQEELGYNVFPWGVSGLGANHKHMGITRNASILLVLQDLLTRWSSELNAERSLSVKLFRFFSPLFKNMFGWTISVIRSKIKIKMFKNIWNLSTCTFILILILNRKTDHWFLFCG